VTSFTILSCCVANEIDEHALRGLIGVKMSHTVVNDIALVNLTVRASEWEELSTVLTSLAARECT